MILHQNSQPTPSPPPRSDVSTDEALLPIMTCYCGHTQEARTVMTLLERAGRVDAHALPARAKQQRQTAPLFYPSQPPLV